jgi:endoglycosylceramidase
VVTVAAAVAAVALAVGVAAGSAPQPLVPLPPAGDAVSVGATDVVGPLRFRGRDLVDATGRVVQIHGVNSVAKSEPFVTPTTDGGLGPADLAAFDRDGVNGVRLGVWPAALMPAPGRVDGAYLDRVRATVDALAAHGLWVLLDLHQDVFAGMPDWATTPAAAALDTAVPDGLGAIGWSAAYVTPRSLRQWDDWWANAPEAGGTGVVDAYAGGVAALAARMSDVPEVIGVEILNEPFPGSRVLSCVFGGCPDLDAVVAARSASITDAVRAAAPDMAVWWEPESMFPVYAGSSMPRPMVTPTATGAGVGLSFHAYCLDTDGGQPVEPAVAAVTWCDGRFADAFSRAAGLAGSWGAPAVFNEFWASRSPLNVTTPARTAEREFLSWFHWSKGTYPDVVESQLVRAYAQATAGELLEQRFDPATGEFVLRYRPDPAVTAPTSVVVPQRAYPGGYDVSVVGGAVTSAPDAGRLTVAAAAGSTEVRVLLQRR